MTGPSKTHNIDLDQSLIEREAEVLARKGKAKRFNPARQQVEVLVNLAKSCLRDRVAPDADLEILRLASEILPLDVEVVIGAVEALPADIRAGVMVRLADALGVAAVIGTWNIYDKHFQDKILRHLRGKALRKRKEDRFKRLQSIIDTGSWPLPLVGDYKYAQSIRKDVRKAFGCTDTGTYPSKDTIRRAVRAVLKQHPEKGVRAALEV